MTTNEKWLLDELIKKRNNAPTIDAKMMYNRKITDLENGLCPYCKNRMVYKDKKWQEVNEHKRLVHGK